MKIIFILFFIIFGCNLPQEPFNLTEKNYNVWRDYIKPTDSELLWRNIPWKNSFRAGMIEANVQNKPLLLWVMNGHPLGCT